MDRLLNVMTVFSALLIAAVLSSVRRAHIRVEYSVSWLIAGLVMLILSRWMTALDWIADLIGISQTGPAAAPLVLLMVTGTLFMIVLYRISLRISSLKDSNIALAQRLAILEFHLESLNEKAKAVATD
jgi:hypothetical protein